MKQNIIDRLVNYVSPVLGVKRLQAKFALNQSIENIRKYEGASQSRRTSGWESSNSSVNTENLYSLHTLRNRSRDLCRNNPWAKRAIEVIYNHTVGSGIVPAFNITDDKLKKDVLSAWKQWSKRTGCDILGRKSIYSIEKLIMRTVAISGECIIRKRRINKGPGINPIRLQIQEGDVIDSFRNGYQTADGNTVIQGVEFNKNGERAAYWLFDEHPGDNYFGALISRRIPASDVLHVFEEIRPGQVRGIPMLTTVMIRLRDYDVFDDAQLTKQKLAACFTAFVKKPGEAAIIETDELAYDEVTHMEPGLIEYLNPGEEITFATPPKTTDYSSFAKNIMLGLSAGTGLTYEALSNDYSNVNFSSARMGGIEMQFNIEDYQNDIMISDFCEPIMDWFIEGAILSAQIRPKFPIDTSWTPPRRIMIDPVAETNAKRLAIQNGLTSWHETVRADGYDPRELAAEIAADQKLFDEFGITPACDPRVAVAEAGRPSGTSTGTNPTTPPSK